MNRKHIPKAPDDAMTLSEDGHTVWRGAKPDAPSSWFIYEDRLYMHCEGVYGFSLLTLHSVDTNGEVNASVLCTDGVGGQYHEFVILDNWPSNWSKSAGTEQITKQ